MAQVFLLPNHIHTKMLRFIQQILMNQGLDCKVVKTHNEAMQKVNECFGNKKRFISKTKPLRVKGYILNADDKSLFAHGEKIFLRKKEFELMQFMLLNHGAVLDRNTILERVWDNKSNPFTNTVDVHMSHLRKKLVAHNINIIKTIHGAGYKLEI